MGTLGEPDKVVGTLEPCGNLGRTLWGKVVERCCWHLESLVVQSCGNLTLQKSCGNLVGTLKQNGQSCGKLVGTLQQSCGNLARTLEQSCGNLGAKLRNKVVGTLGTLGTLQEPCKNLGNLVGTWREPWNLVGTSWEPGGMSLGAAPACSETFTMAEDPKACCCWGKINGATS